MYDNSFREDAQALGKSFLPGIGNSRQGDNFRTLGHNTNEKNHHHNRSVFDGNLATDEKKIPPLPSRSHNNSLERPSTKKYFDDNASGECNFF